MNKKLLNGILVVLGVLVMIWMAFPFGMIIALAFWIYLGVMVWQRKPIFQENMEPGLVEKNKKRLKTCMIVAVISFPVAIAGIIMHNVRSARLGTEEALFFFIGVGVSYVFILASAGGLVIFLKGRQRPK